MRMALRAQNQCRMTLETLATIKNPPVLFAKQANFVAGHQQVNNGMPSAAVEPSRAGKSQFAQSRLLGKDNGERLDTGAQSAASEANQDLETVGAVNGSKDGVR